MTLTALRHATILQPEQHWECPNCTLTDVTHWPTDKIASRMHDCKGLRGISCPMVPAGTKCKVEQIDREDYVGAEIVQHDGEGKPLMAVEVTRDEGTDRAVYVPSISVGVNSHG